MVNIGLLLVGSFLEPPAAIMILTPLLLPDRARRRRQPDPLRHHHGGQPQPRHVHAAVRPQPVRLAGDLQPPLSRIYRGVLPFVLINFVALMVITYVPAISLVLVNH